MKKINGFLALLWVTMWNCSLLKLCIFVLDNEANSIKMCLFLIFVKELKVAKSSKKILIIYF